MGQWGALMSDEHRVDHVGDDHLLRDWHSLGALHLLLHPACGAALPGASFGNEGHQVFDADAELIGERRQLARKQEQSAGFVACEGLFGDASCLMDTASKRRPRLSALIACFERLNWSIRVMARDAPLVKGECLPGHTIAASPPHH